MKKISAVLLVLVLVGSVVFAGFTGSITTSFDLNLDTGVYGFTNAKAVDIDMVFQEWLGAKKGEGDIYAEINAKGTLSFDSAAAIDADADATLDAYLALTSAKIIAKDWWVGICSSAAASDLAVSAIDVDGDAVYASMLPSSYVTQNANGLTVGLTSGYTFSVGVTGDLDAPAHNFYGSVVTPEYPVADGMTAKFAAAAKIVNEANAVAGSAKFAYKTDEYSANLAADLVYAGDIKADVAVNSTFGKTTVNAYFATNTNQGPAIANYLEAKVATTVDKFTITASGTDLVNTQALCLSAKMAATAELAVTGRGKYTIGTNAWEAGTDVVYTAPMYVGTVNLTYKSANELAVTVKAETTKLVAGATLTGQYVVADLIGGDKGTITAKAYINF